VLLVVLRMKTISASGLLGVASCRTHPVEGPASTEAQIAMSIKFRKGICDLRHTLL
jgi:hypothetical protein